MMREQERARHELLARLEEILGPDEAATLMENLPPQPWSELVTKDDLSPLKSDVSDLRVELGGLRTEMRAGFAHLGEVLDLRLAAQDARFEAFVRERIDSQTKLLVFAFVGALLTTAGIALGSAAL